MKIPAKVEARIGQSIKKFQSNLSNAKNNDVSEADTSLIVVDMLSEVLGYKKVEEISAEHPIKGDKADYVVRTGNKILFVVEVKAVGKKLGDGHLTQVVNYAANLPCDWVVLTNGLCWQIYKVNFTKPIEQTLFLELDLTSAKAKGTDVVDFFGSLSREVFTQSSMMQSFQEEQAMSTYSVAAILVSDPVVYSVRRELRRLVDGLNPDIEEVRAIISDQVIKRELMDGDEGKLAAKAVKKMQNKAKAAIAVSKEVAPANNNATVKDKAPS